MKRKNKSANKKLTLVFFFVLILDQLSKYYIRSNFNVRDSINIIDKIFSITYVRNTGVSFGMFKGFNELFVIVSVIIFGFFMYIYLKKKKYPIQFALIFAGIIGNLIDRIYFGSVIDFFNFHLWPVFNIADSSISIGILWLIIILIKNKEDLF